MKSANGLQPSDIAPDITLIALDGQPVLLSECWRNGWKRPALPPELIGKVARQIEATREVEYSCDDVHRLLDQFAEAVLRGENAASLWPLVQRHLDTCPDCREEFEALMRVLRAETSAS